MMLTAAGLLSLTTGLAAAMLGVLLVRHRLAVVEVTGRSMEPALSSGDRVLVRRAGVSRLRPGMVVVVERPRPDGGWAGSPPGWPPGRQEWMIKRVTALPGDHRPADVPSTGSGSDDGIVPPGMFVVLGDNAAWSHDSRMIGCVPAERLLGVMLRPLAGADRAAQV